MAQKSRRLLVAIALIAMVAAGLVSFFLVKEQEAEIRALTQSNMLIENKMQSHWQTINGDETRAHTSVLVWLLTRSDKEQHAELKTFFNIEETQSSQSLAQLLSEQVKSKQIKLDSINDLYIEKLAIQEQIIDLTQRNERYVLIAFCLQMISLVLIIITRDM